VLRAHLRLSAARGGFLSLILSCEHASGHVPKRYAHVFGSPAAARALSSHRGLDLGALPLARDLARICSAPLLVGRQTRLLVDLNRSPGHRASFSSFSLKLDPRLLAELEAVRSAHFGAAVELVRASKGQAMHVAVHSFTPVLNGQKRTMDVGLLYDPSRKAEVQLATRLDAALSHQGLKVRRNAPYKGVSNCVPTWLRRRFSARRYVGLELEVNQSFLFHELDLRKRQALLSALVQVLRPA